jgi:2-amino-4-hydroxy-6-hydroxymethyldihydropteridine diphosphokinase
VTVAIALGSNLGDRRAHLDWALDALRRSLSDLRASSYIETEPEEVSDAQPPYLNGAAVGRTDLPAEALLTHLLDLERQRGRRRESPRAARTLDLDLILYGTSVIEHDRLHVPHPRFRGRRFVLHPLAEIAPELVDPVSGRTVRELLEGVAGNGERGTANG